MVNRIAYVREHAPFTHKLPCHSCHSGVVFIKLGARRCLTYTLASTLPHRDAYSQVSLWNQRRIVDDCLGIIDARFDTGQPAAGTAFASSFSKTVAPPFSHEVRSLEDYGIRQCISAVTHSAPRLLVVGDFTVSGRHLTARFTGPRT